MHCRASWKKKLDSVGISLLIHRSIGSETVGTKANHKYRICNSLFPKTIWHQITPQDTLNTTQKRVTNFQSKQFSQFDPKLALVISTLWNLRICTLFCSLYSLLFDDKDFCFKMIRVAVQCSGARVAFTTSRSLGPIVLFWFIFIVFDVIIIIESKIKCKCGPFCLEMRLIVWLVYATGAPVTSNKCLKKQH